MRPAPAARTAALAARAALALALAAAAGCRDPQPPDAGDVSAAPPLVAASAAAEPGARLTLGISQEFETLNPLLSNMAAATYIYYLVGHPLLGLNADWEPECWLCVQIPTLENGGAQLTEQGGARKLRSTWQIKPDARWGDGAPVTGRDVELAWRIGSSPSVSVPNREPYETIEAIEIDPADPRRFTLQLREPLYYYYLLAAQLAVLPAHIEGPIWERTRDSPGAYEKQTAYVTQPENPGLYSGPYRIAQVVLGSHVALTSNAQFREHAPQLEQLVVKLIPNTQTLEANLVSHSIDVISEIGMSLDQGLAFEKRAQHDRALAGYAPVFKQGVFYEHIDLNLANPILADLRVRKALVHGIDRQQLVDSLFEGRQSVAAHGIHPRDPTFSDDVVHYAYDPLRAAALLDEAGWRLGADGWRSRGGRRLSLQLMTTAQNKTRELVQVFLQAQWRKLGIEIAIRNEPARVFFGETVRKRRYPDMAMYARGSLPDYPPRATLHSSQIPSEQNGWSGLNSTGFRSEIIDRALDAIRGEFDFEKRRELMRTVQREYTEQLPAIPLFLRAELAVLPTELRGYQLTGHGYFSTLRAEGWTVQ